VAAGARSHPGATRISAATARERPRPPRTPPAALTSHYRLPAPDHRPPGHQLPTPADAAPALAAPSGTRPPSGHGLPSRAHPAGVAARCGRWRYVSRQAAALKRDSGRSKACEQK
jgi:hypothetical protein